ncbi:MAG: DUF4437 domain-containing protein [Spongiibacteraceae bacterium]
MRPHVELIDDKDLIWHVAEFEYATGSARQRNLCYDEEDGSVSAKVEFTSDWQRPAGVHSAQTEWYILEGEVQLGDQTLVAGDYWAAPKGVLTPAISVKKGSLILLFREYGDWQFEVCDADKDFVRDDQKLVVAHSSKMDWIDVESGSPMRFDLGGTPVPGLYIKMLYRDEKTGFYTRLIKAKPGWREHPLAHHPVFEEAYCLEGSFDYNYGKMWPGTYFFRPALVRHGDFTAGDDGTVWLLRCDGDLVDWYTDNAKVEMHGDAVNWGPEYPHTEAPVLLQPVRSRSIGPMDDPAYQ